MNGLMAIVNNHALVCGLIAWFLAQALKIPLYRVIEHQWDFKRFFGAGGMPSSHTALVVSLGMIVGVTEGFDSVAFAICFAFAGIVMYDATGVRRETGTQGKVINQILRDVLINGQPISDEQLKELVGHTPLEVLGGFVLGIAVALVYLWARM